MQPPRERQPQAKVTYATMTSECVYKLITAIERLLRWFNKTVLRPYLFLFRCLLQPIETLGCVARQ